MKNGHREDVIFQTASKTEKFKTVIFLMKVCR